MTTKAQEREALDKIRNILGSIDDDGWVNAAFRGVCDIAENNIRDDFCDSPVERVEELKKELEAANGKLRDAVHFKGEYDALKEVHNRLHNQDLKHGRIIERLRQWLEKELEETNEIILDNCIDPNVDEFKKAVERRQDIRYLLEMIDE